MDASGQLARRGENREGARRTSHWSLAWAEGLVALPARGLFRSRRQPRHSERNSPMRALLGVYDKTGIEDFARGLVDLGWDIISTGGTFADARNGRHPGPQGGGGDGLPGDARWPREDAPPGRARRHPRPPRRARSPGRPRSARHRADRPRLLQPLSLRRHRDEAGRDVRGGHREHRHRRADDAPRRGQEPPRRDRRS